MTITFLFFSILESLIPIVAITAVFSIPLFGIYQYYKQKAREMDERKLMIEKGITPPPLSTDSKPKKSSQKRLYDGLNLIAVSTGLLVGYFLSVGFGISSIFAIGGSILFFLGIANLIIALQNSNEQENEEK